jgi:proteasome alpha subunit
VLKERYSPGMSLSEAFGAALAALTATGNGERTELAATQLEVAILDRTREHRTFRRIRAARLEELIAESRAADAKSAPAPETPASESTPSPGGSPPSPGGSPPSSGGSAPSAGSEPATGPDRGSTDRGGGVGGDGTPPNPL